MKRKIIAGKEFCTYVKTPLIADDVHAYNIIWETGITDKNAGMVITAKRNDGVTVTDYAVTDEQGQGEYTLAGNMYSVTGPLEIRLSLVWETTTLTEKVMIFEVIEGSGNEKIESEDTVPILNTILAKATEAVEKTSQIPTRLSQFENDGNFVQDKYYVHTDNNFTTEHKNAISTSSTQISELEKEFNETSLQISEFEEELDAASAQISELEEELKETTSVAKGANQAISFSSYSSLAEHFNSLTSNDIYNTGQNVMIVTVEVPDLWISEKTEEFKEYTYTTDEDFVNSLNENKILQIGYYKFSQLETQKVNLEEYVKYDEEKESKLEFLYELNARTLQGYAVSFGDYKEFTDWFNEYFGVPEYWEFEPGNEWCGIYAGQYISIRDPNLPDLVLLEDLPGELNPPYYKFESNEKFLNDIKKNGYVRMCFYKFGLAGCKNYQTQDLSSYSTTEQMNEAIKLAIGDVLGGVS